jgi:hypothetical protein
MVKGFHRIPDMGEYSFVLGHEVEKVPLSDVDTADIQRGDLLLAMLI